MSDIDLLLKIYRSSYNGLYWSLFNPFFIKVNKLVLAQIKRIFSTFSHFGNTNCLVFDFTKMFDKMTLESNINLAVTIKRISRFKIQSNENSHVEL